MWYITLLAIPLIQSEEANAQALATKLGMTFNSCNANATATGASACLTQAVNAHADVIVTDGIPQALGGTGYQAVEQAGIPLVTAEEQLSMPTGLKYAYFSPDSNQVMRSVADALIVKLHGKANILMPYLSDLPNASNAAVGPQGAQAEVKKNCPGCHFYPVALATPQAANWAAQIGAALEQHPDANAIFPEVDPMLQPTQQAVQTAGKSGSLTVAEGAAGPSGIQGIQGGTIAYASSNSPALGGAIVMDQVVHMLLQKKPVSSYTTPIRLFYSGNVKGLKPTVSAYNTSQWWGLDSTAIMLKHWGKS